MSYRNQLDHELLDRHMVLPMLQHLAGATVMSAPGVTAVDHHLEDLEARVETELEERFLTFLKDNGLKLPEAGQVLVPEANTRPDFLYRHPDVAIYVDGPDHQYPDRQARDVAQEAALRDAGWKVIRFAHYDDWSQIVDSYRWVFGEGSS